MARELPNPSTGSAGQIPKINSNGTYALAADDTGGSGGNPDITYINAGDAWVDTVETAAEGDIIWFRPGTHKDTTHTDTSPGPVDITTANLTLHIAPGAVLMARDGLDEEERFLQIRADNVTLRGGGTIDGNQANSNGLGGVESDQIGHEHIIDCVDAADYGSLIVNGLRIYNLTIQNAGGGDGIYINDAHDVVIDNVHIDNCYRNGISIISTVNCVLTNIISENTAGVQPRSGIAFEANGSGEPYENVVLDSFITRGNGEDGLYINSYFSDGPIGADVHEVQISNGLAVNNGNVVSNEVVTDKAPDRGFGFQFGNSDYSENIRIDNCTARRNWKAGFVVGGGQWVRMDSCVALENGQSGEQTARDAGFICVSGFQSGTPGEMVMSGCMAADHQGTKTQKHPGLVQSGATARVMDMQIGPHAYSQDGFRSSGTDSNDNPSELEYHLVDPRSGDAPAFTTNSGSMTNI